MTSGTQSAQDPNGPEFRQGNTLGPDNGHGSTGGTDCSTASTGHKIIVYAWVNDEGTLRKSGSRIGPYAVFKGMLESSQPPSSFRALLRTSKERIASK
jgi:toxin YhaV